MGIFFTGKELVEIAIGIERNGAIFYDSLVNSTQDVMVRGAYKYLADKEREHIEVFHNMLGSVGEYQPPETHTEEYALYLKALVDSAVFTDDQVARAMAQKVSSDAEAIQIALGAEKDSDPILLRDAGPGSQLRPRGDRQDHRGGEVSPEAPIRVQEKAQHAVTAGR